MQNKLNAVRVSCQKDDYEELLHYKNDTYYEQVKATPGCEGLQQVNLRWQLAFLPAAALELAYAELPPPQD